MPPKIVTLGAHGLERDSFFQALTDAHVDVFCDLRRRRGMRGTQYTYANSERLQRRLDELGIRYISMKELAPSDELRAQQYAEDKLQHVTKRTRVKLAQHYIDAYERENLSSFDPAAFLARVGPDAKVICLFCVEREPAACHRSLVAQRLADDLGLQIEHLRP